MWANQYCYMWTSDLEGVCVGTRQKPRESAPTAFYHIITANWDGFSYASRSTYLASKAHGRMHVDAAFLVM